MRAQAYGLLAAATITTLLGVGFLTGRATVSRTESQPQSAPNYTAAATAGAAALYQITTGGGYLIAPPQINSVTTAANGTVTVNLTLSINGAPAGQYKLLVYPDGTAGLLHPFNSSG